ncbi:MAG: IS4 family transposase [Gemmataceae bacterium]
MVRSTKVLAALQRLLGPLADDAAAKSGVIRRQRVFSPRSLVMTFVWGYLRKPQSSVTDLAQMAVQVGAHVTPQAVDQRRTPALVSFLEHCFRDAVKIVVGSSDSLAPLLERFPCVSVLDSSTITLPDSQQEQFAGCGGSYSASDAAMKLQTELDLRSGALLHIEIEPGKSSDGATIRQQARRGAGSLRISDLGYFNVSVFAAMDAAKEYFLSRLHFGTSVFFEDSAVELLPWLEQQPGPLVDQSIALGGKDHLRCRLIAWRVPPEVAARRRQKLRAERRSKDGKEPSAARLAWCDWGMLVTNVPVELLTPTEAVVLYRARWQIELLFKRWKSGGLMAQLTGANDVHTMVSVWSRLLACLVQHWLLVATSWGDVRVSWDKAGKAIRDFASQLAASLNDANAFEQALAQLTSLIAKTCRRNPRKKIGTVELLNQPDLLDFCLT